MRTAHGHADDVGGAPGSGASISPSVSPAIASVLYSCGGAGLWLPPTPLRGTRLSRMLTQYSAEPFTFNPADIFERMTGRVFLMLCGTRRARLLAASGSWLPPTPLRRQTSAG